jgi:hypothetical protein
MMKPQLAWWASVDNSYYPFLANLNLDPESGFKPQGKYPLQEELVKALKDRQANPQKYRTFAFGDHKRQKDQKSLPHPYQRELEDYDNEVALKDLPNQVVPRKYLGLDHTPFLFVENEEQMREMAEHLELDSSREIAVDLEHHNFRSYQGFTCLMQISTRDRDFVVDTIKLRSLVGKYLSGIFADCSKVKVLHGSDYDVEWLQKDYGIYIINLFDTG